MPRTLILGLRLRYLRFLPACSQLQGAPRFLQPTQHLAPFGRRVLSACPLRSSVRATLTVQDHGQDPGAFQEREPGPQDGQQQSQGPPHADSLCPRGQAAGALRRPGVHGAGRLQLRDQRPEGQGAGPGLRTRPFPASDPAPFDPSDPACRLSLKVRSTARPPRSGRGTDSSAGRELPGWTPLPPARPPLLPPLLWLFLPPWGAPPMALLRDSE